MRKSARASASFKCYTGHRGSTGKFFESNASLCPLTDIIGVLSNTTHTIENPALALHIEYVEMPDGSSSDAPVMTPVQEFRITDEGGFPWVK